MAGTGKRADHKKTLVLLTPGYFGKSKALRRGNLPKKLKSINVQDLKADTNYESYKILSKGEAPKGIKIKAAAASKAALEKIKAAGGAIELPVKKEKPAPKKEESKK